MDVEYSYLLVILYYRWQKEFIFLQIDRYKLKRRLQRCYTKAIALTCKSNAYYITHTHTFSLCLIVNDNTHIYGEMTNIQEKNFQVYVKCAKSMLMLINQKFASLWKTVFWDLSRISWKLNS